MRKRQTGFVAPLLGLLLVLAGCTELADIREGDPLQEGVLACATLADCQASAGSCQKAAACAEGVCTFEDIADGEALPEQTPGDCARLVCDGAGKEKLVADAKDLPDDGNPCTEDRCEGTATWFVLLEAFSCYTGPDDTKGQGICKAGVQQCDENGNPVGICQGEVTPGLETCDLDLIDEDCDGQANENGTDCICSPGISESCYSGPEGTEGVGICHGGTKTCTPSGRAFGPCIGEITPKPENCAGQEMDEDCDGLTNEEGVGCKCGDGEVSNEEECDDGNQDSTDGCTILCKPPVCGDGLWQPNLDEKCDDGNGSNNDACLTTCVNATCGDGFIQVGVEQCDDANASNTDACPTTCMNAKCGDGFIQDGVEQCDDGNGSNTDACPTTCMHAKCGDGFVQTDVEPCDDGNVSNTDACLNMCLNAKCGDGFVQSGVEECDDGTNVSDDGCTVACVWDPFWASGVQENLSSAKLTGSGWQECWSGAYGGGTFLSGVLAACNKAKLLMACRPVGSATLTLAAMAPRADVLFNCGSMTNCTKQSNGVGWYHSDNWSWGFAPGGESVNRSKCDSQPIFGTQTLPHLRLCWYTWTSYIYGLSGGNRCGDNNLDGNYSWERVLYHAN